MMSFNDFIRNNGLRNKAMSNTKFQKENHRRMKKSYEIKKEKDLKYLKE